MRSLRGAHTANVSGCPVNLVNAPQPKTPFPRWYAKNSLSQKIVQQPKQEERTSTSEKNEMKNPSTTLASATNPQQSPNPPSPN
ncbi:hypothetical protein AVEN_11432-1 [Araneus ventricosus]|uniref:Uncharacterized protein n=1 Tax=Araneus ventricosus TaxID=182803 RepID=A0A4Y2VL69_ARAVE|nr:hypothetical protein AVEN_11432-1 [Araneus ventricosus]